MTFQTKIERSSLTSSQAASLPLATLLSHVLVAFTIEFDNESEHRMPHRTTNHGSTGTSFHAPWLVSLVMWPNCMQYVGAQGVTVRELERLARATTNFNGLQRWGYIAIEPDPADRSAKPPRSEWVVRVTPAGQMAQKIWAPLFGVIERRWQERFGKNEIDRLRKSLRTLISQFNVEFPDCMPILGYGLFSRGRDYASKALDSHESGKESDLPLSALLSRALLYFALDFEAESEVSLAISANLLRVLEEQGVRVRDLPSLTGVSKEAISVAMGILLKRRIALVEPSPSGGRAKIVRLTSKGRKTQETYRKLLAIIEERWRKRFGKDNIRILRESLQSLVGESTGQQSPLFRGLEPYPDGWRASVRKPSTLPHYPMVLHRGGFPDGS